MWQKIFSAFDLPLFLVPTALSSAGLALLYSLTTERGGVFISQLVFVVIGFFAMIGFSLLDYRLLRGLSGILFFLTVALLLAVVFFGRTVGGATRWLDLGFFQLQPSEILKATTILYLADRLAGGFGRLTFGRLVQILTLIFLPIGFILVQPDFGTAGIVFLIALLIISLARPSRFLLWLMAGLVVTIVLVISLAVFQIRPFNYLLRDYQRERIVTFFQPDQDPYGGGYNVSQSIIAVGSGGLFGRGLDNASQSRLNFLPSAETDFAFAGLAEAFGFVGASISLILFFVVVFRAIHTASQARDDYGYLVGSAIAVLLLFEVLINIGMNLGLMPVTGIPLPFISYGGTQTIVSFALIGILQSIYLRRKKINFD